MTAAAVLMAASAEAATISVFTDRGAWETAVTQQQTFGEIVVEDFSGPRRDFLRASTGNQIGSQTTLDVLSTVEPGNPPPPAFITGTGALQIITIGTSTSAPISYRLNVGGVHGFALTGTFVAPILQANRIIEYQELGIRVAGQSFIVSDILGLTDSSNGQPVPAIRRRGLPLSNPGDIEAVPLFIGFASDMPLGSFELVHGDLVVPQGVPGSFEVSSVDDLVLATAIPLPAGLPLLAAGLGLFAMLRRRRRAGAG
ncbi:MAG: hypothetical protein AAF908_05855 [Pseudomonadota bacterium]